MPKAIELKRGMIVEYNGAPHIVHELSRSAPTARGSGTRIRVRLYNVLTKGKADAAFESDELLREADFQRRAASYSYKDGDAYVFMDDEDYTQYSFDGDALGSQVLYIGEELKGAMVLIVNEQPAALELPGTVEMTVESTPPAMKAASATSRTKPASFATGLEVQVPEYIESGEKVRISTATDEFMGRA